MAIHIKPATKVSEKLTKMLNEAIAREIAVSILYMWQHVLAIGVKGIAVQNQFRQTAITEMKHAEAIAERLWYLGGVPPLNQVPSRWGLPISQILQAAAGKRVG